MSEHAVIVHFTYGSTELSPLFELEDKLETAISEAEAGEYDGNDVATDGSDGYLYMYGPDADRLFEVVKPILERTPFMQGAIVKKRYGPAEEVVREDTIILEEPTQIIIEEGHDADTYYNKGLDAYRSQKYIESKAYFDKVIELDQNDSEAYYNRAMVKSILGNKFGAVADYDKATQLNPRYEAAYGNRGAEKDELGDLNGAISDYDKVIEFNPNSALAYFNRGNTKYKKGDKKGACTDWAKAKDLGQEAAKERLDQYCR